jgi:hypothetical protein
MRRGQMNDSMTDGALQLAAAGWRVFPVNAESKRPRTKHGHLDATTDEQTILGWSNSFDAGGAIATPTGNGLLVVDVDPRNGGVILPWLEANTTLTAHTQSGGWHFYFSVDEDIKSRAGMFGRGVDSKSAGGYVLVPPSPGYTWALPKPRRRLASVYVRAKMAPEAVASEARPRKDPADWYRGIIHEQVVAWAAYFAATLDDPTDVVSATWGQVDRARAAGVEIDNARGHIDRAIRWVLHREDAKITDPVSLS